MPSWKWLILPTLALAIYAYGGRRPPPSTDAPEVRPRPVHIQDHPLQTSGARYGAWEFAGAQMEPLAEFHLEARVLARKNYHAGREAELSPLDLALGWGPMADPAVLRHIDISQSNRFYFWRVAQFPIPRGEIESHSANMHLIPANAAVAGILNEVEPGQTVRLHGLLVEARYPDGWHWRSSLTRADTGQGACELIWVSHAEIR